MRALHRNLALILFEQKLLTMEKAARTEISTGAPSAIDAGAPAAGLPVPGRQRLHRAADVFVVLGASNASRSSHRLW